MAGSAMCSAYQREAAPPSHLSTGCYEHPPQPTPARGVRALPPRDSPRRPATPAAGGRRPSSSGRVVDRSNYAKTHLPRLGTLKIGANGHGHRARRGGGWWGWEGQNGKCENENTPPASPHLPPEARQAQVLTQGKHKHGEDKAEASELQSLHIISWTVFSSSRSMDLAPRGGRGAGGGAGGGVVMEQVWGRRR